MHEPTRLDLQSFSKGVHWSKPKGQLPHGQGRRSSHPRSAITKEKTMQLDANTIRAVTHEVCNTTFGMPVFDQDPQQEFSGADHVCAEICVEGDWNAKISIVTSKNLARQLAGRMFHQDAGTVEECDVEDSLCEFANIIGGNLKGIVGQEANLSIPAILESIPQNGGENCLATSYGHEDDSFCVLVDSK